LAKAYDNASHTTDSVSVTATIADLPPTFITVPGYDSSINIVEGQTITINPFVIRVKPADDVGVQKVEFYVDNQLLCTATTPDFLGIYNCAWDTSLYHSEVKVIAYDTLGNPSEPLIRNTTVDQALYMGTLPKTGLSAGWYLLPLILLPLALLKKLG
jgi:hypothetical protein